MEQIKTHQHRTPLPQPPEVGDIIIFNATSFVCKFGLVRLGYLIIDKD